MQFEDFVQKRISIKDNVEWLLRKHPECKNDYRKLIRYFWFYVDGLKEFIPMEKLNKLTQPESITRAFRELSSMRKIPKPSERMQEARIIQFENYQEYYSRKKREANDLW